jgi:glucosamine--fructose-6-phosphate aminotransferase (isomerizing)
MDLHNKLRSEKQLYTTVVTNVKEYAEMADHSVVLPEECDGILGVYGCAIFSQLFACLLAIERGYNPDFPVGLSKVTVTR